jgi:HSP20 family protein
MRFDPFRDLDRLTEQVWGGGRRPMAMDAYRKGDELVVQVDLRGVDPGSIDLTVERSVLTLSATREWQGRDGVDVIASERPHGTFTRQLVLGDNLDADHLGASYDAGVLTLRIPVAEQAKPRKVDITTGAESKQIESSTAAA